MNNQQVIENVTARIVEQLKAGVKPWDAPWDRSGGTFSIPRNVKTQEFYHGINIPILWEVAGRKGYSTNLWIGYDQAKQLGGHVKKDEKGTHGLIYKSLVVDDEAEEDGKRTIPMLKSFVVFNLDQIAGLEHLRPEPPKKGEEFLPIVVADDLLKKSGARIVESGPNASYRKADDLITLPDRWRFKVAEDFYATGLHELGHWTGHEKRLNREWGNRFGDNAYAFEELVAEMASAFLCAHLGLTGELQHENYIGSWLKILKDDYRALVKAASQAQKAFEFICALVEGPKEAAAESQPLAA
jgi:antirestriction protein ArdC